MLTEQQLKERKLGIGGSDLPAICGISRFKTALDIYNDKISDKIETESSVAAKVGSQLESLVLRLFSEKTKKEIEANYYLSMHEKFTFMRGNIDGFVDNEKAIVECKTTRHYDPEDFFPEDFGALMPPEYILQCAHYAAVYDVEIVYVPVLLLNSYELRIAKFERDEKLENKIIEIEKEFWWHVENRIPPKPQNYSDALQLWPNSEKKERIVMSDKIEEVELALECIKLTKESIKASEELLEIEKTAVAKYFEEADTLIDGTTGKVLATWKTQKTNRIDSGIIKTDYPEIYQKCLKESQSRVLRIK